MNAGSVIIPLVWEERYARRCKAEHVTDAQRDALQRQVGADGQWLLERLEQADAAHLRDLRDVGALRDVWAIQYARDADGQLTWVAYQHGARLARYVGMVKNHLRALYVGVAVNLAHGAAWLAGRRPKKLKTGLGLVAATT